MDLILDACTVLNLLQIDIEEDEEGISFNYNFFANFDKLMSVEIVIVKKVFNEIEANYSKNLKTTMSKRFLSDYIKKNLYKYIHLHQNNSDFESSLAFVKRANNYKYDNGELHSTAYALYKNRYCSTDILKSIFITDDDGAIKDFSQFFQTNMLGQIVVTIDLLIILFIHELLDKSSVVKFATDLRLQYLKGYHELRDRIFLFQKSCNVAKESAILTKLMELINCNDFQSIEKNIINHTDYRSITRKDKNIKKLLDKFVQQDCNKVQIIDEKILALKKILWDIDAIT